MSTPTPEQAVILDSDARVRVVRSTPGSGKTWLVAELIRREISNWTKKGQGIAALSFTRVGGEEIRKAVGYGLSHPHFVGTIDAYIFRYIIRPFLTTCFPELPSPRLVPAEWGASYWKKCGPNRPSTIRRGTKVINLFGCTFVSEEMGELQLRYQPGPGIPMQPLAGEERHLVVEGKKELWRQTGLLTHSDVAYWASRILEHGDLGATVRSTILARFPLIVVDELQDTGHFLGKTIRLLLGEPNTRGVLVGDPDQAIYEFNGADPALFSQFEGITGARVLPLTNSRRCSSTICAAATHLKSSGGDIGPAGAEPGRALLVKYVDLRADVIRIAEALARGDQVRTVKIIARQNATIDLLLQKQCTDAKSLYCPALHAMSRAVKLLRLARPRAALAAAHSAIDLAVFEHENVSEEEHVENDIDPNGWRALAIRCLLRSEALTLAGHLYDWQTNVGAILDDEFTSFDRGSLPEHRNGRLRPQQRPGWDRPVADCIPSRGSEANDGLCGIPAQTVHAVKGETHDVTVFVCPAVHRRDRCPSAIWWSAQPKDQEEKRIAYVAMTRTREELVVLVPQVSYQRLHENRGNFVASFRSLTVEECVRALVE
ncbi:UvrD-helicase domain-containing protein [bacterium]|nr:UvrD-helicase domain-containing protein [bacterium]